MNSSLSARLRYRWEEFLSSGAGKQLLLLFVMSVAVVLFHAVVAIILGLDEQEVGASFGDKFWFFFARIMDAGTMGGDSNPLVRVVSTVDTLAGVIVAGLLISSLAGNFQERLDAIKRGSSPVVESGHFLVLGWSEKIFSVIDQLTEAYADDGRIVVVVMADGDKVEMEEKLRDKVVHQDRVKLVVRAGSSLAMSDLAKVALGDARAVIVLVDEADESHPDKADGRIIKTLMAIFNHPTTRGRSDLRVTAEVMLSSSQEIASIASGRRAEVVRTNDIISKIILQTARIPGLSLVYDELLRFEGSEVHFKRFAEAVGRTFGSLLLDFPEACLIGYQKPDQPHVLNPPADYVVAPEDELMFIAENPSFRFGRYDGPLRLGEISVPPAEGAKPAETMLVLGWNEKVFPIVQEFDSYVGPGSRLTMVNSLEAEERERLLAEKCGTLRNTTLEHVVGEFSSRAMMDKVRPHEFPDVMVLGDTTGDGSAEEADTRAIIALLLLRDYRQRNGVQSQDVCSEILNPKNRELAATTEIHDIVISNEMVSMVLAQVTFDPRVRPVLEDFFDADGCEVYLKDLSLYWPAGKPATFEELILAAKARDEVAMGLFLAEGARVMLNPADRRAAFGPKPGDRLIVLAEEAG